MASLVGRPLHYVIKIGDRKKSYEFYVGTLGMKILRYIIRWLSRKKERLIADTKSSERDAKQSAMGEGEITIDRMGLR